MNPLNKKRTVRAHKALAGYYEKDIPKNKECRQTAVVDLLSDLRHYCERHRLDYEIADRYAQNHHGVESMFNVNQ